MIVWNHSNYEPMEPAFPDRSQRRMHGFRLVRAAATLARVALAACCFGMQDPAEAGERASEPTLDAPRMISLAPSLTESLVFVGARDRLVGKTRFCLWPAGAVEQITVVGGMADPSVETLLALRPDVVVATPMTPRPVVQRLEALGLQVRMFDQRGIDGVLADLATLSALARVDATARIEALMQRVTRLKAALATIPESARPAVLVLYGLDGLHSAGTGTFPSDIIAAAGGHNVVAAANSTWPTLAIEQIVAWDPEVILVTADHLGDEPRVRAGIAALPTRPVWSGLRAVRNDRVLLVGDSALSIPGPRTVDAVERLARELHPQLFREEAAR
jgi:iron complex transport system substrate-binding protein